MNETQKTKKIELSTLDEQIFMVAKNHYGHGNKIETLRKVIMKVCGLDSVSINDIYSLVADCFLEYVQLSHQKDAMRWMFNCVEIKPSVTVEEATKWMLGAIATITMRRDEEDLFDVKWEKVEIEV